MQEHLQNRLATMSAVATRVALVLALSCQLAPRGGAALAAEQGPDQLAAQLAGLVFNNEGTTRSSTQFAVR